MRAGRYGRATGAALVALLLAAALWSGPAGAQSLEDLLFDFQLVPLDGRAPAPFSLPRLDGERRSLSDFQGQVVLLYFWASW